MNLGLVLSGGGARGAFEAGVVAAMEDAGLGIAVVSGTSAGAINAAGIAAGFSAERLGGLWTSLENKDVYRQRRDVWRLLRPGAFFGDGSAAERILRSIGWNWLWDWAPLRRTLVDIFDSELLPMTSGPPLVVSTVQVTTGDLRRFASSTPPRSRGDLTVTQLTVDHLIASAAIPLLFRPGRLQAAAYWDGSVVANTPLAPVLSWRPERIIAVTTTSLRRPAPEPATLADSVSLLVDAVQRFALDADLARAEDINQMVRANASRPPHGDVDANDPYEVDILLIDPRGEDLGDGLHFDPVQARRLFDLGRQLGGEQITDWQT